MRRGFTPVQPRMQAEGDHRSRGVPVLERDQGDVTGLRSAHSALKPPHRDLFDHALQLPDAGRWPFDLARIQLAYGERLRRTQAPAEARAQLTAAIDACRTVEAGNGHHPFPACLRSVIDAVDAD